MSDIYQIANIGMLEGKQRLEAISLNAASASLTGYRRHVVVGRSFDAALAAAPMADAPSQRVDMRPGAMVVTERALDLAIDGEDAFFALTDGEHTWLTRAGAFRVNEEGVLVGERGLQVVGQQGEVRLPSSNVVVEPDGRITYQGVAAGWLQLFRPSEPNSLRPGPGSLLSAPLGQEPIEMGSARVRSRSLEASNTDAGLEMIGLMSLSRQFESLSRVVQSYDELLGRAIQKLGEV